MIKEIYLVRGNREEAYGSFSRRVMKIASDIKQVPRTGTIRVVCTTGPPPGISIIPFRKQKIASISVHRNDATIMDKMTVREGFAGAYQVTEALPVAYQKTWPDGQETPGACLLTLFNRKKGLDTASFLDRWHNSHTPLSLKIHPLWNYSRNVVDTILIPDSEKWEGIVEEQTRTDAELLNPFKFFGNPLVIIQRMIAVYTDTKSFLDYGGIETYFAREVVVKS